MKSVIDFSVLAGSARTDRKSSITQLSIDRSGHWTCPIRSLLLMLFMLMGLFGPQPAITASELSITGYYKSFFTAYDPPNYSVQGHIRSGPLEALVINRARINFFWQKDGFLSMEMAYDLAPKLQSDSSGPDFSTLMPGNSQVSYRFDDLHATIYPDSGEPKGSFSVAQNLDRFSCTLSAERFDLSIGRQAVSFGSARVINPTDVLTPFSYLAIDTEDRPGVDAIRMKIPIGNMNELDFGFVCGPDCHHSENAAFIRSRIALKDNDLTVLACMFKQNMMAGLDLSRSFGGAGFWLEMAYTWVEINDSETSKAYDYTRLSTGLDYNFFDRIYSYLEYHYNGPGQTDHDRYLEAMHQPANSTGNVYLLGEHYLAPGLNYMLTPLLTADLAALVNLTDPSVLLATSLEYSLTQDVYIRVGAYISLGQSARLDSSAANSADTLLQPRSEFGLYPTFYYSSIRAYF